MLGNFFYSPVSLLLFFVGVLSITPRSNSITWPEMFSRILVLLVLTLLIGLRTIESGPDTEAYRYFFESVNAGKELEFDDIGFIGLAYFINAFTSDSKVFIIFVFLIQFLLIFLSLQKLDVKNISLFIMTFVFLMPGFDLITNTIRQGLSITIGMLAITYYLRTKIKLSIVVFLCSMLVHTSSILFLFIFLFRSSIWNKLFNKLIFLSIVTFVLSNFLNASVAEFMHSLNFPGTLGLLANKLYNYEAYNDGRLSGLYKVYFFVLYVFPVYLYVNHPSGRDKIKRDRNNSSMIAFYLFILLIYAVISKGTFSFRVLYVIYPILICILTQLYFIYGKKYRALFSLAVLISGLLVLDSSQMSYFTFGVD